MGNRTFSQEILDQLEKLENKFESTGQDLVSYLNGLLHSDYLSYWDYIHLDTLLSLQNPKTSYPDEKIFILYHQITELYFKLIIHEQQQLVNSTKDRNQFLSAIIRINRYFEHLINSFDIMIDGMDPGQFLEFRMALLPASGFQSAQYRMIELYATDAKNLSALEKRQDLGDQCSVDDLYQALYWKNGATELATGKKTLTLIKFEEKYSEVLKELIEQLKDRNLRQVYLRNFIGDTAIENELRALDQNANVRWPLSHYKSALRYLNNDAKQIKATGGTNWQKYLPPKRQQIVFFPNLLNEDELDSWGRPDVTQKR